MNNPARLPKVRPIPEGISLSELMQLELPAPSFVVPGVVTEGINLLAGAPKIGKSWVGLGIALAVAFGGRALGAIEVEEGDVLCLALEDTRRRLQSRFHKLLNGEPPPHNLTVYTEWPKLDEGGLEDLEEWLHDHPKARLVVIDTLQKVRHRPQRNVPVYSDDYAALTGLKRLADHFGVAILVVHHTRKAGALDFIDEISGSTGLTGVADTILVLKRDRTKADAVLHITGRDVEEAEKALKFDPANGSWTVLGDAVELRRSDERQEVLDLLAQSDHPMGPAQIAGELGKRPGAVRTLLFNMKNAGEVVRSGSGYIRNNGNASNAGHSLPVTAVTDVSNNTVTTVTTCGLT